MSILIRKLTLVGEPVYLIAFYFSICSAIFGLFTLPLGNWKIPTSYDLGLLILIGFFGSIANLLLTAAYQKAEVSLTTPLKYLSLVLCHCVWLFFVSGIANYLYFVWRWPNRHFFCYNICQRIPVKKTYYHFA